jgi:hypothetical protein
MPKIPPSLASLVSLRADKRCEYCHAPQILIGQAFHFDHIKPCSIGGKTIAENLCFACPHCNAFKSDHIEGSDPKTGRLIRFFNLRIDDWERHFHWSNNCEQLLGRTAIGRATIANLKMNDKLLQEARPFWQAAGYIP